MKCPYCGFLDSKVVDSRHMDDEQKIRRRRECLQCGRRFTSFETVELTPIVVIKKDRTRQKFDRDKLINGMMRACNKRDVPYDVIDKAVREIEMELHALSDTEIHSDKIGEMCLLKLKDIDDVAYIRFASVYRQFNDVEEFVQELVKLKKQK